MKHKDLSTTIEQDIIRQRFECVFDDSKELGQYLSMCFQAGNIKGRDLIRIATEFAEHGGLWIPVQVAFFYENGKLTDYRVSMALHADLLPRN